MFYAINKLRLSAYLCTPSGNRKTKQMLYFSLSLFILHLFFTPLKRSCKKLSFFYSSFTFDLKLTLLVQSYKMPYQIDNRSHGDCTDDNFDYQMNGNVVVNSVTEDCEEYNPRHNADYRCEKVASEAAP